jgi:hypothetical protein
MKEIAKDPAAKKRFDSEVAQLGSVLKAIGDEKAEAMNRVLEFLRDLYRIQLSLHDEDLRHYRGLAGVATQELKRWDLLSNLNGRYRGLFDDVWPELKAKDKSLIERVQKLRPSMWKGRETTIELRPSFTLFSAPKAQAAPGGAVRPPAPGAPAAPTRDHPDVTGTTSIIHSVRLLGEDAQAWQFRSPRLDPDGNDTRGSFLRLRNAMEVINGQLLMVSLNERFSLENGLVLRTEIQEHDLHLDAIAARTREAGMRLGLRDLLAYHSSGITDADIQAAIGLMQQAILINICRKL